MDAGAYIKCFDQDQLAILCANYDSRIDSLGAENKKLREERREYQVTIDSLVDECADHKAENEKLRQQIQAMWPAFIGKKRSTFADRLRVRRVIDELGIEVLNE